MKGGRHCYARNGRGTSVGYPGAPYGLGSALPSAGGPEGSPAVLNVLETRAPRNGLQESDGQAVDIEKATRSSFLQQKNGGAGAAPDRTAVVALLLENLLGGAESRKTERGDVPPVATVEHCSAISCHSMLWREVTLQSVLYFDIVCDVIACT